jgi:hypothetical protein
VTWLLGLQLSSGAFPGGHEAGSGKYYLTTADYLLHRGRPPLASVFNSAQILRGLTRHYRETGDQSTLDSVQACAGYLVDSIGDDGMWAPDAYAGSSSPSYFAYCIPPLLEVRDLVSDEARLTHKACKALGVVTARQSDETGFIAGMGFSAHDAALSHTVGYTLAGLLDSGRLLGPDGDGLVRGAVRGLEAILASMFGASCRPLPGVYLPAWEGDWSFSCVTGDCQIGLCFLDGLESADERLFHEAASTLCRWTAAAQTGSGGFPGSRPIYGAYMRLRYPNWAAKYYMDLVRRLRAAEAR